MLWAERARHEHRSRSWSAWATLILLVVTGCANQTWPISYTPGQPVPIGSFTVVLPGAAGWEGRDLGSKEEGIYLVFGRELSPTRTLVAAATDLIAPARQDLYEARTAGKSDPERLEFVLDFVEQNAPKVEPGAVEGFWRGPSDRPVVRQGVACREYGYETLDHRVPGHPGEPFRMVLRGDVCLDPGTGRPIQLVYSERYLESIESLRPEFKSEVDAYFDSLSLGGMPSS
jgi:hypothetical protein